MNRTTEIMFTLHLWKPDLVVMVTSWVFFRIRGDSLPLGLMPVAVGVP